MKLRRKYLNLILGSASPIVALPFAISAGDSNSTTENNSNSNTNTGNTTTDGNANPAQPTKPKTVDKDFPKFKDELAKIQNTKLGEIIDAKVKELRKLAGNLLNLDDETVNKNPQTIVQAVYLQKVADYLEKQKAEIIKTPDQYGIDITFPKVLAYNEKFYEANIGYDGTNYSNTKFGIEAGTNYGNSEFSKGEVESESINNLTLIEFQDKVNGYFDQLSASFSDIFYNDQDVPVLKITDEANANKYALTTLQFNENHDGVEITLPENYKSWNEYIREKILHRFLSFDLLQNSNDQDDEDNVPTVPIIDEPIEDPLENTSEIQNVPNLKPFVSYEFYDSLVPENYQTFVDESQNNPIFTNNKFKFANSIFTRYEYKILDLRVEGGVLLANVQIKDRINTELQRTYSTAVEKFATKKYTKSAEAAYDLLQTTFKKFYDALGIGETMRLKKIGSDTVIMAVYNMIVEAQRLIDLPEFQEKLKNLITLYQDTVQKPQVTDSNYKKAILNLFLGSLDRINLDFEDVIYGYFEYLSESYRTLYSRFLQLLNSESRQIAIKNNFAYFKYDLKVYEKGFNIIEKDIDLIKGVNNSPYFTIEEKYNILLLFVTQIQKLLINLSVLSIDEVLAQPVGDNQNQELEAKKQSFNKLGQ
ncbi:MSC_0620 family F1-like ATPase-associated subunit [Mycoplasmopsis gallopavonis]|uniref:Uncharacterized protein n=1 Tax=Mycoplasmopsis gallopavonis TaxID=76629 RepID=A0A449B0E1_9BACT|nr:hypothetical protein [Mycoplasmopsis gallopavonis]RIV16310.1 hypothetical protein D1113_02850 [Mycoplasmopsis gallopavonis]VEU73233.1 Uncharacterised protein [Mycoplasmopsis gallopavonis]